MLPLILINMLTLSTLFFSNFLVSSEMNEQCIHELYIAVENATPYDAIVTFCDRENDSTGERSVAVSAHTKSKPLLVPFKDAVVTGKDEEHMLYYHVGPMNEDDDLDDCNSTVSFKINTNQVAFILETETITPDDTAHFIEPFEVFNLEQM